MSSGGGRGSPLRYNYSVRSEQKPHHGTGNNPPSRHLWVGNLSHSLTEADLAHYLLRFGELESIAFQPGRSYAFVNYMHDEQALAAAKALQGFVIAGNPLTIDFAKAEKSGMPPRYEPCEVLWIGFPDTLEVDEFILRKAFSPFGEIERIGTFPGRSYAFVGFRNVMAACWAKQTLQGNLFGNSHVHIYFAKGKYGTSNRERNPRNSPPSPRIGSHRRSRSPVHFRSDRNFGGKSEDPSIRSPLYIPNLDHGNSPGRDDVHERQSSDLPEDGELLCGTKKLSTDPFSPENELSECTLSVLQKGKHVITRDVPQTGVLDNYFDYRTSGGRLIPEHLASTTPPFGGRSNHLKASFDNFQENEIKEKGSKIEQAEQPVTTLSLELKAAESKIKNYNAEMSALKLEIREMAEKVENANSIESKAFTLELEKLHLEQKYRAQFDRFEELEERCKSAEKESKRAIELADQARAEAVSAQKDKNDFQRLAMERLAQIKRVERLAKSLERQKSDLASAVKRYRAAERDALFEVKMLEERAAERKKEFDTVLQSNITQRKSTVAVLKGLLESERVAHAEANNRAETLSVQLQNAQAKLDEVSQELTALRFSDKTSDGKQRTASHAKRGRTDDYEMGVDSVHNTGTNDKPTRGSKRTKINTSPLKFSSRENGSSVFRGEEPTNSQVSGDYTKFTALKLRQVLTEHNYADQLLQLKSPNKKDLIALYEKCVLGKS